MEVLKTSIESGTVVSFDKLTNVQLQQNSRGVRMIGFSHGNNPSEYVILKKPSVEDGDEVDLPENSQLLGFAQGSGMGSFKRDLWYAISREEYGGSE